MRARARLHLLDWLGCVAGARRSWGLELTTCYTPIQHAALLGNVLEMDDVHRAALLHPGPVVWPAALADADELGTLLDAGVRGYEAMISVGATFDARHYAFHHNTATAGPFGAAAAAGSAKGWRNVGTFVHALGLAGSVTGGLWQLRHELGEAKQFHILHAVETGRSAALAAAHGLRGPRSVLDGPQGLWAATCDAPRADRLLGPADGWRMAEVSFKPWAACRHAHPAIDAALMLRAEGALDGGPVLVEAYADALGFCDRPEPRTVLDAKFSLQHAVAVVAARGAPRPADFEAEAIAALAPERARVAVREAPEISARYPDHFGARVSAGGRRIELVDTLGDPERPLDEAGVVAKARELMAWGGVTDEEAERMIAFVLDAPEDEDAGFITDRLAAWLGPEGRRE